MTIRIRDAVASDEAFMWRMLGYAASDGDDERSKEDLRADPALGCYLDGWGRTGDVGVVAVDDGDDTPIGAAWVRLFTADRPGYGFIDEATPELTIACLAKSRGRGVGRSLIEALLDRARRAGFAQVGLSVAKRNPRAKALYLSCGFRPVGAPNEGGSVTLVASTGATSGVVTTRVPERARVRQALTGGAPHSGASQHSDGQAARTTAAVGWPRRGRGSPRGRRAR